MPRLTLNFSVLVLLLILASCASSSKSPMVEARGGTPVGAVNPGPKGEGRIQSVHIGGAAGSLLGVGNVIPYEHAINDAVEPTLLPPRVEARFVDEQVRGDVFVPAHLEYIIVEPARWSK